MFRKLIAQLKGETAPDGFVLNPGDPLQEGHELLTEYLMAAMKETADFSGYHVHSLDPREYPAGMVILAASPTTRLCVVRATMKRHQSLADSTRNRYPLLRIVMEVLLERIMKEPMDCSAEDLQMLIRIASSANYGCGVTFASVLRQFERFSNDHPLTDSLKRALRKALQSPYLDGRTRESRACANRVRQLLGEIPREGTLDATDVWAAKAVEELDQMDVALREHWQALFQQAMSAGSTQPSKKWLQQADALVASIGVAEFCARVLDWFPLVGKAGEKERLLLAYVRGQAPTAKRDPKFAPVPLSDVNCDVLKGLVWCCSRFNTPEIIRAVGEVAEACFRKIPQVGARSTRVGNAALSTLGSIPGREAVAQLGRLQRKVKYRSAQSLIDKTLSQSAQRAGLTREELEELAVPTYGLEAGGVLTENFGDYTAELRITGTTETELRWRTAGSKVVKSTPAAVQRDYADDLKALKQSIKDIERMLPAQRDRLERLCLCHRSWDFAVWQERYLNHPVVGAIARRLVWQFEDGVRVGPGVWWEGVIVDEEDRALDWLTPTTIVQLWHPIGSLPATVLAWRLWFEGHAIAQPFKQAHREVYLVTDAELLTETYSNRFAAHILRQHQFNALCSQRGWKYNLMGWFDSHNVPTLELPRWGLRAEFWVEAVGNENDLTEAGIALHVSTDQVRFYDAQGPLSMAQVPPVAFSEVMRDIDLFVGVASVANDPTWMDRGDQPLGPYWHDVAFGDLSVSAQTRQEVLARLLPKLKIADRCSLDGKFLVVRGDRRTYRIHLGSGNILMEPNSQYLCIVPNRGIAENNRVWLPFEGDGMLSIILSKAILLANDRALKDPTILRQLGAAG